MTALMGCGLRAGPSSGCAVTTAPWRGWPSELWTVITKVAAGGGAAASAHTSAARGASAWKAVFHSARRAGGLIPALVFSLPAHGEAYDEVGIRALLMGSFRKRLLVLIIGLVIVTQTVTLAAVLASTRGTVEQRSREQLGSGTSLALQLMRFRAGELSAGVSVTAADFGFREAVASADPLTVLSAARNNSRRVGADMVMVLDTRGKVIATSVPIDA